MTFDPDPPRGEVQSTNFDPHAKPPKRHKVMMGAVVAVKVLHRDINRRHRGQEKHEVRMCRSLLKKPIEHKNIVGSLSDADVFSVLMHPLIDQILWLFLLREL